MVATFTAGCVSSRHAGLLHHRTRLSCSPASRRRPRLSLLTSLHCHRLHPFAPSRGAAAANPAMDHGRDRD
uniref:Uncharacterized protein n=1 Tax=Oryza glumipatula TaxID=40148 RepID=A0A0E0B5M1_9ORYZ